MKARSSFKSRHDVNLWIVPLRMALAAVLLFGLTMVPDLLAAYHVIHLPDWFSMGGIDDARAILASMLGCVSTVLALIFSVALLVLSMVANLFGPRLLYRFVQDWVTQACIGLFMGAFIYVFLVFLVTHKDAHSEFIPQVSLITSWFLVLAAFGFLVFYSHRVSVLIQNPDAVGRIVDDLRRAAAHPRPAAVAAGSEIDRRDLHRLAEHETDLAGVRSPESGYFQLVDQPRLVLAAARCDALIVLHFRPGQFVLEGETLASVSPASRAAELASTIAGSISFGRHRVLAQDVEFGLAQMVEIAIRALSAAINDTFTGIACVDFLGESLALIAEATPYTGRWRDSHQTLRLQIRPLRLDRLVRQAFDQIRQAAADNPAVSLRLLSTIHRLAESLRDASDRRALLEQAEAVWETVSPNIAARIDREDLYDAWQRARDVLTDVWPLAGPKAQAGENPA